MVSSSHLEFPQHAGVGIMGRPAGVDYPGQGKGSRCYAARGGDLPDLQDGDPLEGQAFADALPTGLGGCWHGGAARSWILATAW